MAIFTLALELLAGQISSESVISSDALGTLGTLTEGLRTQLGVGGLFLLLISLAVLTQLLRSGLQFGARVAAAYLTAWVEGDLRRRLFHQFTHVSYAQISQYKTGDLVTYAEQVTRVGSMLMALNSLISLSFIVIAYAVILLWLSWSMTLAALIAFLLLSSSLRKITQNIRQISRRFIDASVSFNENLVEYLGGMRLLHTFSRVDFAAKNLEHVINESVKARRLGLFWNATIPPLVESITVVGLALFLVVGYLFIDSLGNTTIPRMITFVFVLYRLLPRITAFNSHIGNVSTGLPFATRIAEMLRTDDKEYLVSGDTPFPGLQKSIEFHNVTLRYQDNESPAVTTLSFRISSGSMVALVGASGSGKSTTTNLLLRLYDPTDGEITVDGIDLRQLKLEDWRNHIGIVDQETVIFNSSVAENIRFGKLDADPDEIIAAAKVANAHEFILNLVEGYDTLVGDRGYRLSGGQRQRIAIARAVLRDPDILIFDEATSALDSKSERLIQDALDELRQERTLVVIAHRLSTVAAADQIFVLDEGAIVESGTHQEMLHIDGVYAALWRLQSKSDNEP